MFSGYLDETLNADAFDDAGFFRTGDLGTVDSGGYVRVTGRIKDIILRNAENISAVEIENVLISYPGIADVTVIGLPDPRTGERCCAIVVMADGAPPVTLADLARTARSTGWPPTRSPSSSRSAQRCRATRWARSSSTSSAASSPALRKTRSRVDRYGHSPAVG